MLWSGPNASSNNIPPLSGNYLLLMPHFFFGSTCDGALLLFLDCLLSKNQPFFMKGDSLVPLYQNRAYKFLILN